MNRSDFLASVSSSIASLGSSLGTIALSIQNHPATGDADFDPDGTLANAASQLQTLSTQAKQAADSLNPATPGGVTDTTDAGTSSGDATDSSNAFANSADNPASDAAQSSDSAPGIDNQQAPVDVEDSSGSADDTPEPDAETTNDSTNNS